MDMMTQKEREAVEAGKCPKMITRDTWHVYVCGKPIKRDGLCGVHAAARDRVRANDAKREEQYTASKQSKADATATAKRLNDMLGCELFAAHVTNYASTPSAWKYGVMCTNVDELNAVLDNQ